MQLTKYAIISAALLAGCATVATYTIENRLRDLGLSAKHAECMADELNDRLTDNELAEFARFTVTLTERENSLLVLESLSTIQNPTIAKAVGTSGLVCIIRG